ncbi:ankyrin repeat-containing protein At5g02620-like isoform X4 [Magnolia sinica]|uniref:ankyrin repeat-containing protein At5g02620-like isoform X4 n=1 Tax=Magnolia sinica TaxID=86752 RepID=UPI00265AEBFC|nr:ankyrin repeat-containing protein At5g02620-like isoform X4 [Magnolia sinica]
MSQVNVLKAALQGEWEAITTLYRERPTLCDAAPVTAVTGNTLIHIAVQYSGRAEVVSELLDLLPERVRVAKNNGGNTSLHEAARAGNTEIATVILKKDEGLITSRNSCGETPVFCAATHGKKEMLNFLVSVAKNVVHEVMVRRNDGATILHAATLGGFYADVALEILELCPEMAFSRDNRGMTALHLLAFSSSSFKSRTIFSLQSVGEAPFLIYEKIAVALYASCPVLRNVYIAKQKHTWALQLVKRLIEKEAQWRYEHDGMGPNKSYGWHRINDGDESKKMKNKNIEKKLDRPLILATKFGIVELVREIVKVFPESVEFVDEAGKNLLHLAVEHRQEYVLKLLNKMRIATAMMAAGIDIGGNTILHLAAKLGEYKPKHVSGPAIHMQWESVWFERVKKLCPAHLVPYRNRSNLTAKQVFTQSHRSLLKQGEEWLKDGSNTCIVVSTLIATVTFAAAFTIPGGNDSGTGLPVLQQHPNFIPFIEYIAVSLLFSLLSLAMFLSIYASRFEEEDFLAWLPIQCFVAITALFNSVVFTVSAFMIAFLLVTDWNLPKPVSIADIALASVGFSCFCPVYLHIVYLPICYSIDLLCICI